VFEIDKLTKNSKIFPNQNFIRNSYIKGHNNGAVIDVAFLNNWFSSQQ